MDFCKDCYAYPRCRNEHSPPDIFLVNPTHDEKLLRACSKERWGEAEVGLESRLQAVPGAQEDQLKESI